jgi:hypothetical protein
VASWTGDQPVIPWCNLGTATVMIFFHSSPLERVDHGETPLTSPFTLCLLLGWWLQLSPVCPVFPGWGKTKAKGDIVMNSIICWGHLVCVSPSRNWLVANSSDRYIKLKTCTDLECPGRGVGES